MDAAATPNAYPRADATPTKPDPTDTAVRVTSWVAMASAVPAFLVLFVIHALALPRFIAVYNDFDSDLPALTIAIVSVPGNVAFVGYSLLIASLIAKEFLPFINGKVRLTMNVVALFLGLVIFVVYLVGLFLPMIKLQQSVM
jgi:type II secretory pathway component PulF